MTAIAVITLSWSILHPASLFSPIIIQPTKERNSTSSIRTGCFADKNVLFVIIQFCQVVNQCFGSCRWSHRSWQEAEVAKSCGFSFAVWLFFFFSTVVRWCLKAALALLGRYSLGLVWRENCLDLLFVKTLAFPLCRCCRNCTYIIKVNHIFNLCYLKKPTQCWPHVTFFS